MADSYDVIIVGGGMIGLATALALAQKNFTVALVESHSPPEIVRAEDAFDLKVVAITRASENFLMQLDVWDTIKKTRSCAYQHMKIWDSMGEGLIEFSAGDYFEPDLGHIVEQQIVCAVLWQALLKQSGVTLMTNTQVTHLTIDEKSSEIVITTGERLQARLIIGADGANSVIRTLAGITVTGWQYGQSAVVATVQTEQPHQNTAFQRFAPDGPLALLPLPASHYSSIVWTTSPSQATLLCEQEAELFNRTLTLESNAILGKIKLLSQRKCFSLSTRHAKQYAVSRCVLVGDAAHTIHPLAGQGVNTGFQDVCSLVNILGLAKSKGRDYGALNVLKRYERQRKMYNQGMIWSMEIFKRGFSAQSLALQVGRNKGLNWVNQHLGLKQVFVKLALG